jgi:hypothetical protein
VQLGEKRSHYSTWNVLDNHEVARGGDYDEIDDAAGDGEAGVSASYTRGLSRFISHYRDEDEDAHAHRRSHQSGAMTMPSRRDLATSGELVVAVLGGVLPVPS